MMIDLKRSVFGAVTTLLLGIVATQLAFVLLLALPSYFFFQYSRVEVAEPVYVGKPFHARSFLDRYWTLDMTYSDTLFCRDEPTSPFFFYSSQTTELIGAGPKTVKDPPSEWVYTSRVPWHETVCYINSTVYATLPFGIRKIQTIRSSIFTFQKAK